MRNVFERYHITDDQDLRKATEALGTIQPAVIAKQKSVDVARR